MKDTLFVLRPSFDDQGTRYFCPSCAQVIGFLTYYPAVQATLEIVELEFAKPRAPLVAVLGEAEQSAPRLVVGGPPVPVADVTLREAEGHTFIKNAIEIIRYLAVTRNVPQPHP